MSSLRLSKWLFLVFIIQFFSCKNTDVLTETKSEGDPYSHPIYEQMLDMEVVEITQIQKAFDAYTSTHSLSEMDERWFYKRLKALKMHADINGIYRSPNHRFQKLLAFRNPTQNGKEHVESSFMNMPPAPSIAFTIPNPNGLGAWKNVGPKGNPDVKWSATGSGALDHIEMHPTDPSIMYASSRNAGLWKTTNYGENWINITAHFPTPHVYCSEVSADDPNIIYISTGGSNIYYTSDEGMNWDERSTGIMGKIYDIRTDPTDSDRVIAATLSGIYLSTNAGLNWTQKIAGEFTDFEVKEDFSLILLSRDNDDIEPKLYFSTDKGNTWQDHDIVTTPATVDRMYLSLYENPTGQDIVMAYGIDNDNTPTRFIGLWKSSFDPNPTGGQDYFDFSEVQHPGYNYPNGAVPLTYSASAPGYQAETEDYYGSVNPYSRATWVSEFWISPNDSNRMLTMREKFWGTEDGGLIWDFKPSYGGSNWADNRFITMNTAKDSLYWCNDGGLWSIAESDLFPTQADIDASGLSKSAYMNSKVVPKNGDISLQEGSQMDVSQLNKDVIITGGQDIGQVFERAGHSSHVASADVYRGRIKPTDDKLFITGGLNIKLGPEGTSAQVYNSIEADRGNPDRMYGFTKSPVTLARSPQGVDGWLVNGFVGETSPNAGGHSWTPVHNDWEIVDISGTGITNLNPHTFEQSRANPEIAFLGDETGNRIFITENLSSANPTWTELVNAPSSNIYRFATHDLYEDLVVVATSGGIYVSKNKGKDWYIRKGFPESDVKRIVIDKNEILGIYVMTGMNVYYINESLQEWQEFNKGLPLFQNNDMRIGYFENGDNRLYVGKYGSGIWSSPLKNVLDENQNKPIADFKIDGGSTKIVNQGEEVVLFDLSMNADNLEWKLENGADIIILNDETNPSFTLNTIGYYKVTLTASNANGSDIEVKEKYIRVILPIDLDCAPAYTGDITWFKGIDDIDINGDVYNVPTNANYSQQNKIFEILYGEMSTLNIDDNYNPGFNFWWKIFIDYNNDGIFSIDELVLNTNGPVDNFTVNFTPPANAVKDLPLHFRVTGRDGNNEPDVCGTLETRQVVDLKIIINSNIDFTQTDVVTPPNSVVLDSDYTGANNVIDAGFVVSTIGGDLNIDNSTPYLSTENPFSNNDNINVAINDLLSNTIYYYKPFLIDDSGYAYGDLDSFVIAPKDIPLAESIIGLNLGNDLWEITGVVFPNSASITSAFFEHGETDFNNSAPVDVSGLNSLISKDVAAEIMLPSMATEYKYRIRLVVDGIDIFSNVVSLDLDQVYCTPSVGTTPWYKRWNRMILEGITHNESTSDPYEDATSLVFDLESGKSYVAEFRHVNSGWWNLTFYIYIDLNNDNDFDDLGELVGVGLPTAQIINATIDIPTKYIVQGKDLRMRVVGAEGNPALPCEIGIGNIKDFTVHIDRCENIVVVDASNMPFIDGKTFKAAQEIRIEGTTIIPAEVNVTFDAPVVKAVGNITPASNSSITIDGDGCIIEE